MAEIANKEVVVEVKNVSKEFTMLQNKNSTLKQAVVNIVRKNKKTIHQVLDDVSFKVYKGDFFGIVGRNGSGKSTLLKLIAGVYEPTKGNIYINGKLIPFIELGVGFNPELSGRDNIYLNGAMLGFTRKQMSKMYDEIVEFAELEPFMDQKLKNYSSGMQVRLAFSIAIKAKGDILVFDEVLAVGDESFQRKCNNFFETIKKDKKKTVILVTHSMDAIREYCNKAILIDNGKLAVDGTPEDVSNDYSLRNLDINKNKDYKDDINSNTLIKNLKIKVLSDTIINQNDKIKIKINYETNTEINTKINLLIQDIDRNVPLFATNSSLTNKTKVSKILEVDFNSINDSNIKILISIRNDKNEIIHFLPDMLSPILSLKRTDYPDPIHKTKWALLFDRGRWIE